MKLEEILKKHRQNFSSLFPFSLNEKKLLQLDLSVGNKELLKFDLFSVDELQAYIEQKLLLNHAEVAVGGYAEDRMVYRKSKHFGTGEHARSIHLGIDIWLPEYTEVRAPLDAQVHSFLNNDNFGDYGPTIILEHELEGEKFFTLYGHLSQASLEQLKVRQAIKKGESFAQLGNNSENGKWPPHLHFQLIKDMGNKKGDYPGVASKIEKDHLLETCPNPRIILNLI